MRFLYRVFALGLLLAIGCVTLGPVADRPQFGAPQTERFLAYLLLGGALSLGWPRHRGVVLMLLLGAAWGLELAQLMVPGRDARFADAAAKTIGGLAGMAFGGALSREWRSRAMRQVRRR